MYILIYAGMARALWHRYRCLHNRIHTHVHGGDNGSAARQSNNPVPRPPPRCVRKAFFFFCCVYVGFGSDLMARSERVRLVVHEFMGGSGGSVTVVNNEFNARDV